MFGPPSHRCPEDRRKTTSDQAKGMKALITSWKYLRVSTEQKTALEMVQGSQ